MGTKRLETAMFTMSRFTSLFFFFFVLLAIKFCVKRMGNKLNTYNCIVFTGFEHTKLYPFQNLSLGFILNIFLNFRKF